MNMIKIIYHVESVQNVENVDIFVWLTWFISVWYLFAVVSCIGYLSY